MKMMLGKLLAALYHHIMKTKALYLKYIFLIIIVNLYLYKLSHLSRNQQAVVADNATKKPKVVIIHQQNETLTESFVHFLEDRMVEHRVKFVF